jgi:hypothetical protein
VPPIEPFIIRIHINCRGDIINQLLNDSNCRIRYIGSLDNILYLIAEDCVIKRVYKDVEKIKIDKRRYLIKIKNSVLSKLIRRNLITNMFFDKKILYIDLLIEKTEDLRQIITELMNRRCRVKVVKKNLLREYYQILTERQRDVLYKALEKGFFEDPRRISLHMLSKILGISASTIDEHIRKGVRKILYEYVIRENI